MRPSGKALVRSSPPRHHPLHVVGLHCPVWARRGVVAAFAMGFGTLSDVFRAFSYWQCSPRGIPPSTLPTAPRLYWPSSRTVSQTVKDVVQSLVDDGIVSSDKCGVQTVFWCLPSAEVQKVRLSARLVRCSRARMLTIPALATRSLFLRSAVVGNGAGHLYVRCGPVTDCPASHVWTTGLAAHRVLFPVSWSLGFPDVLFSASETCSDCRFGGRGESQRVDT